MTVEGYIRLRFDTLSVEYCLLWSLNVICVHIDIVTHSYASSLLQRYFKHLNDEKAYQRFAVESEAETLLIPS